jgi:hypothetical protein
MSFIYLGQPYTHSDPAKRYERFYSAFKYTAAQLIAGEHIYSPIVHCHEMAIAFKMPKDFDFWEKYNYAMLTRASELRILKLSGWEESVGLKAEIVLAERLELPISFVELD